MSYSLAILIPSRDMVNMPFAYDLARLTAYWSAKHVPKGGRLHLFNSMGTLICDQRQNLILEALNVKADYVLWLDSDHRFPKDMVDRLHSHQQPIVAANYSTRRVPAKPVALANDRCDELVYTTKDSTGLEEVAAIGMGAMLESTEVYKKLGLPFFTIGYSQAAGDFFGEDVFHCRKAREAGFKVMVDHDVSKEVRHIGSLEFTHEHAEACRDIIESNRSAA